MTANAYALRPATAGEAPKVQSAGAYGRVSYAVPSEDEYTPGIEEGFSPALGEASENKLPDDIRTQKREPLYGGPHQAFIHRDRGVEAIERRADETEIATGWTTHQEKPEIGVIPDQIQDIGPSRPTASMGPNNQLFTRPWGHPESTGEHLSMADHRRKYEIYGMKPQGGIGVNTYRLDPKPWDRNLQYRPIPSEDTSPVAAAVRISGNKSYRLG